MGAKNLIKNLWEKNLYLRTLYPLASVSVFISPANTDKSAMILLYGELQNPGAHSWVAADRRGALQWGQIGHPAQTLILKSLLFSG